MFGRCVVELRFALFPLGHSAQQKKVIDLDYASILCRFARPNKANDKTTIWPHACSDNEFIFASCGCMLFCHPEITNQSETNVNPRQAWKHAKWKSQRRGAKQKRRRGTTKQESTRASVKQNPRTRHVKHNPANENVIRKPRGFRRPW